MCLTFFAPKQKHELRNTFTSLERSFSKIFTDVETPFSSSSLLAHAAIFSVLRSVANTIISLLVFIIEADACFPGLEGGEDTWLWIGVVSIFGVPFLEGSWITIGFILVFMSLNDTYEEQKRDKLKCKVTTNKKRPFQLKGTITLFLKDFTKQMSTKNVLKRVLRNHYKGSPPLTLDSE